MKRTIGIITALSLILCLFGCFEKKGDVKDVTVKPVASDIYSEEDIDSAINVIKEDFKENWGGCVLKEIYYIGDDELPDFSDYPDRYGADEVIVLLSTFDAVSPLGDSGLNEMLYTNWNWILVREKGKEWKHVDHGY